jgi:hypothetical protein
LSFVVIRKIEFNNIREQLSPISTKRAITSHLKPLNTKRLRYHGIANPGVDFGQTQKCGRAKPSDGIDPHPR